MTREILDGTTLWLRRREDLLALSIAFHNVTRSDGPGALSTLAATDSNRPAQFVVTFPPQAVLEQVFRDGVVPGGFEVAGAQFSNPSTLVFTLESAESVSMPFTAEGLLGWAALRTDAATVLECVWGLALQLAQAFIPNTWLHHSQPDTATDGITALWRTSLRWGTPAGAPDFDRADSIPLVANTIVEHQQSEYATSLGDDSTTSAAVRAQIVDASQGRPLAATAMSLTALGATLDLSGNWPDGALQSYHHRTILGRDDHVSAVTRGHLMPFGFAANWTTDTVRTGQVVDGNFGAAVLYKTETVVVSEPVITYPNRPGLPHQGRGFPFRTVRVHERVASVSAFSLSQQQPQIICLNVPGQDSSPESRYLFHLTAEDYAGNTIDFAAPAYFIPLDDTVDLATAIATYDGEQASQRRPAQGRLAMAVDAPADTTVDVTAVYLGAAAPTMAPVAGTLATFPRLAGIDARIPAVDALSPAATSTAFHAAIHPNVGPAEPELVWAQDYLTSGLTGAGIYAQLTQPRAFLPPVTGAGGLASLNVPVVGLSQLTGLVGGPGKGELDGLKNGFDPATFFPGPEAATQIANYLPPTLLGFIHLADLVGPATFGDGRKIPQITTELLYDTPSTPTAPKVPTAVRSSVTWAPNIKPGLTAGVLQTTSATTLDVRTTTTVSLTHGGAPVSDVEGELCAFDLVFAGGLVTVTFDRLAFTAHAGSAPRLDVKISKVAPGAGALAFFQQLLTHLPDASSIPLIDYRDGSLVASYSLAVPAIPMGAFLMQNLAIASSVTLPLDGRPVKASFAFASREHPFLVAVSLFGGGGFLALDVVKDSIDRLEAQLDFGAAASLDLIVASASVTVTAGIHLALIEGGHLEIDGFFRATGQVDLLGIISISLEIYLALEYDSGPPKRFTGTAEFTVRVAVAFWSQSLSFSVSRSFSAGADPTFDIAFPSPQPWQQRCAAFAPMVTS